MAYIKFLGDTVAYKATVIPENHIVTLKFEKEVVLNNSGFNVYLDEKCEYDIGGTKYQRFTTVYRNDSETEKYNGYQLSDNGTVYVEPEPLPEPEPQEPTLEELKEMKISEMNSEQQKVIRDGIDVKLSSGLMEHFTLTEHDQTSLMGLQTKVLAGEENIPWHTSDETEHCKFYSNADMALITESALAHVAYHVTLFRDLRIYIRSMETKEEVKAVTYNTVIPEEYRSEPLKAMVSALKV